jgi:hypothetical protein
MALHEASGEFRSVSGRAPGTHCIGDKVALQPINTYDMEDGTFVFIYFRRQYAFIFTSVHYVCKYYVRMRRVKCEHYYLWGKTEMNVFIAAAS